MKDEKSIEIISQLNKNSFNHELSSSLNKNKKIQSHDKIILPKNKVNKSPNKLNLNGIINNKKKPNFNISKGTTEKADMLNTQTRKIIKINNNNLNNNSKITSRNNLNINKKLQQNEISNVDNNLKNYKSLTLKTNNKIKKNKNNNTLIKINIGKPNQEIVAKQKNDISTDFLFKSSQTNLKDSMNKTNKNGKSFFISNFSKQKKENNNTNIERKAYNSNNNILDIKQKIYNKKKNNLIKKVNTFTNKQNIDNTIHNNSTTLYNSQKCFFNNNKAYFTHILNNSNKKNINLNNNKRINSNNNIPIIKKDNIYLNNKIFGLILNNNSHQNYFKNNIKTMDSNSKINGKKYLKKIIMKKFETSEENQLKRFKTEKNLELTEFDTNINQLINKKKNKYLAKEISMSSNNIKSFQLKINENLSLEINNITNHIYNNNIYKKIDNSENIIGMSEYKLSPIKPSEKKNFCSPVKIINSLKKKKNIKMKNIKEKKNEEIFSKKNIKKINNILKNSMEKENKNFSMRFEKKDIYQNNKNKKNKIFLKNYYTIESNNMDINSSNLSNSIKNKLLDSTNTNLSRNTILLHSNNSNYKKNTNINKNKRIIGNIDFYIIEKDKHKKIIKEKKIKNTAHNTKVKNYNLLEMKSIYKNTENKKDEEKSQKNNENLKLIENEKYKNFDKVINYINDLYFDAELEEDYLNRETSPSTSNVIKIYSQTQRHFMNVIKNRGNSKLNNISSIHLSLIPLLKEKNIIKNIMNFCNYNTLNIICLLDKQHYKYIKPYIYNKIRINIVKINENCSFYNNIIKKSVFESTPLSKLSPVMAQKKYKDLLFELNEKYDIEIKKDLLRTNPDNISFQYGQENYNKLYHILSAYSNYNKNIGYAQGINFLAAQCIYIYKNEIEAFIFLDGLIRKFNLENFFGKDNNKLNLKLKEIEYIVNKWCPNVNKHLQKIFLNYDFFTCKWMITLFSHYMNEKYLMKLWDYLIIFGWKFFTGFVISVINLNEDIIINSSLETITKIMNDILKTQIFEKNFDKIIDRTFEFLNEENSIL